jgi:hypothetical protein
MFNSRWQVMMWYPKQSSDLIPLVLYWDYLMKIDHWKACALTCHDMKSTKTNRYQIWTVNIKLWSFLRYSFVTSYMASVGIHWIFRKTLLFETWNFSQSTKPTSISVDCIYLKIKKKFKDKFCKINSLLLKNKIWGLLLTLYCINVRRLFNI